MSRSKRFQKEFLLALFFLLQAGCVFDAPKIVMEKKELPSSSVCGNGFVEKGEECDDGNRKNWDGCSSDCEVESGWSCDGGNIGSSRCVRTSCRISGTVCVDHNRTSGDGCDSDCNVEPGWRCEQNTCSPCLPDSDDCQANCYACSPVCGDGLVVGNEQCDYSCKEIVRQCYRDHRSDPRAAVKCIEKDCLVIDKSPSCSCDPDGIGPNSEECYESCSIRKNCATDCTWSIGWCIAKMPKKDDDLLDSQVCAVAPKCGDGIASRGLKEECDDGNTDSGDGCSGDCSKEEGWECSDFTHFDGPYIIPIYFRDKPDLGWMKDSYNSPPQKYLSAQGLPVFLPSGDPRNNAFVGDYTIKDVMIFSRDSQSRSALGNSFATLPRNRTRTFEINPFAGRYLPQSSNGSKKEGVVSSDAVSGFSSEIKIKFIFNEHMIGEKNKLTFVGDDDVFVFINGIYARSLSALTGSHPAKTGELVIRGDLDEHNRLYNRYFNMREGEVYEMDVFHINRSGLAEFALSIPATIIGPSFCEKCGNGFQDSGTGEQCDDGNTKDGDGCSRSCQIEANFNCYEDYHGKSHCFQNSYKLPNINIR